jgi:cell cycle sensor histidine kinase DivJ
LRIVGFGKPIGDYVDALLHAGARSDALTAARHRAFIATHLLTSIVSLAAFPLYVAARGVPEIGEVASFAWLATPMLVACYLSRTGRYERAHALSALTLSGLCITFAAAGGGVTAIAAVWLVLIPIESIFSASTRVLGSALTLACAVAGLLIVLDTQGMLSAAEPPREWLTALGVVAAAIHIGGVVFAAHALTRTGSALLSW